jgi:uncharacterized protein (TIGR02246 family)
MENCLVFPTGFSRFIETHPMRYTTLIIVSVLSLACRSNDRSVNVREAEVIKKISSERAKAFNEGDAAGIAKHFADKCFLMAPGGQIKTDPEQVKAYYQAIFDKYTTGLESGYEDVKVDGDLAYGRGFAKVRLKDKVTGEEKTSTAKYLNILERQSDGTWKTTHDIWNGNEP